MIFFVDTNPSGDFKKGYGSPFYFVRENVDKYFLLNFMSQYAMGEKITDLCPTEDMMNLYVSGEEEQFEQQYIDYILTNEKAFIAFVEIMMGEYYGGNVVIFSDFSVSLIEECVCLICEVIRKRYGERPVIVKDLSDLLYYDDSEMSPTGMQYFLQDKEFYVQKTTDANTIMKSIDAVEDMNGGMI